MATVSYVDITPGLDPKYWASLTPQDRFTFARITKKVELVSRKKKKGISARSLLPMIAGIWKSLSDEEQENWSLAGAKMGLNGYCLFVQDQTIRIINDLPGVAIPVLLHQSWVGQLHIEEPASELKITQLHPRFYWVSKKVTGKKGMYEPVLVEEYFQLPLTIKLNYRSELESVGAGSFAKFYAEVWSLYQGVDIKTKLEIELPLSSDWATVEATISEVVGLPIRYDLFFHLFNLRGDLFCDIIKAEHSGQNWCRDPFCKDINQGFTRAFYQIPKHWSGVIVPSGSWFESIYKDF